MADAAARREARRLKILQNSESRMNRLLGKPDVSDEASVSSSSGDLPTAQTLPESSNSSTGNSTTTTATTITTDARAVQSTPAENSLHSAAGDTTPTLSRSEESPILPEGVRQRAVPRSPERENSAGQDVPLLSATKPATRPMTRNGVPDSHAKGESWSGQGDPLRLFDLIRCGGCLLVAFLTQWALGFGLGFLFLEWVIIPFLWLEGFLLYFQKTHMKDLQLPHKSSMMSYALVVSGVRQDMVLKYNTVMGYISAVSEDFAIYLFAFLVCNAVIT